MKGIVSKKASVVILIFILIISNVRFVYADDTEAFELSIATEACILIEADTGTVIYEKNAGKNVYPASTTKVMTAILAIENCELNQEFLASNNAVTNIGVGASKAGICAGERVNLNDLLHMLMLVSGNDAANVIAEGIGGNVSSFVKLMNNKAKEIGAVSTNFMNPIGLDVGDGYPQHTTTAKDYAQITRYAMSLKKYRDIVGVSDYAMPVTNMHQAWGTIKSSNRFYTTVLYDRELYTVTGAKTGYTRAALNTLVVSAINSEGTELICVMFGNSKRQDIFLEAKSLFDYGFNLLKTNKLEFEKSFYDIRYRWSSKLIKLFKKNGYISGYQDHSFRPLEAITKEEFIALFSNINKANISKGNYEYWSRPYLDWALSEGYIDEGWYENRNQSITRSEVVGFISSIIDEEINVDESGELQKQIPDFNSIDVSMREAVLKLYKLGIISGYPDGEIKMNNNLTREEMVAVFYKYLLHKKAITPIS